MTVAFPTPVCPEAAGIADIPSRNDHDRNAQAQDKVRVVLLFFTPGDV